MVNKILTWVGIFADALFQYFPISIRRAQTVVERHTGHTISIGTLQKIKKNIKRPVYYDKVKNSTVEQFWVVKEDVYYFIVRYSFVNGVRFTDTCEIDEIDVQQNLLNVANGFQKDTETLKLNIEFGSETEESLQLRLNEIRAQQETLADQIDENEEIRAELEHIRERELTVIEQQEYVLKNNLQARAERHRMACFLITGSYPYTTTGMAKIRLITALLDELSDTEKQMLSDICENYRS